MHNLIFFKIDKFIAQGGGAFSGFMPSTSYFFPRRMQGTALGIQAGVGNFGVSLVQFVTPWIIGFAMVGFLGAAQTETFPGREPRDVWYQNAAYVYVPFVIIGAILAWTMLKSVPIKANVRQQFDIFGNKDTWYMTLLYIMTFGTFAGLSGQFGLLIKNLFGGGNAEIARILSDGTTQVLIEGYGWVPLIGKPDQAKSWRKKGEKRVSRNSTGVVTRAVGSLTMLTSLPTLAYATAAL